MHVLAISRKSFPQPECVTQSSETHMKAWDVWTNDSLMEGSLLFIIIIIIVIIII